MVAASLSISARDAPVAGPAAPSAAQPSTFQQLLSELNPLQYVPVVGTIYRAVTGDTIPETARFAGSLVVSGLTGGPIGLAVNLGITAIEKLLGIDPEKIGGDLLAGIGIGNAAGPALADAGASPASAVVTAVPAAALAWSPAQLTAYGVSRSADGVLTRGTTSGADVLNTLELARVMTSPVIPARAAA